MRFAWLAAVAAIAMAGRAYAAEPALVYDLGGKFDKSFNQAAYEGAERFKAETGIEYHEFEIQNDSQREQAFREFAREGHNPIVAIGFSWMMALERVAKEFPDTQFAIVDMVVDLPNVRSIVFKEDEGSYLVGVLAAMASQSGKVGFVGGMDIPLIRKFACGYVQGAKSVNPDIQVFQNMTGDTGSAWNDPEKGGELAKAQIEQGADVIYQVAGGTGIGVLQAAADAGKLGIGVDSNQNYLHPGSVLTSMLKRVDNAVYRAFTDVGRGEWTTGIQVLGIAEDGVGWAFDDNNRHLITPEMQRAVEDAKAKIIAKEIAVHDYLRDGECPLREPVELIAQDESRVHNETVATLPNDEFDSLEPSQAPAQSIGQDERRVALVIGNGRYVHSGILPNPANDASDVAESLTRLGFDVIFGKDLTRVDMEDLFRKFARASTNADVGLFYYAGHAMQYRGVNYLMPIDAKLEDEADLPYELEELGDVMSGLNRVSGVRIAILDACRDNPLESQLKLRVASTRSSERTRGLARLREAEGLLVAYATQAGAVAEDGDDRNSPFTRALLEHINTPGLEIGLLFRRVAASVYADTAGAQLPEVSVSLLGEFYFMPAN